MRQRPVQASYVQKMERQRGVPDRVVRQSTSSGYGGHRQISKPEAGAAAGNGGKMTNYININDIPDGVPDSPHEKEAYAVDYESGYSKNLGGHNDYGEAQAYRVSKRIDFASERAEPSSDRVASHSDYSIEHRHDSRPVITASPIQRPNHSSAVSDDEEDFWAEADDVHAYRSPTLKQKVAQHEASKNYRPPDISEKSNITESKADKRAITNRLTYSTEMDPEPLISPNDPHPVKESLYFSRNPRKVEYRPYTLEQYKSIKPNGYVEYGKLKPDLNTDELKAKRANAERVKEFAKNLNNFNREQMKATPMDNKSRNSSAETKSARDKALEFSKNVPKPKPRRVSSADRAPIDHKAHDDGYGTLAEEYCMPADHHQHHDFDLYEISGGNSKLQELQMKHGENKKKVDAIKKSLGLK